MNAMISSIFLVGSLVIGSIIAISYGHMLAAIGFQLFCLIMAIVYTIKEDCKPKGKDDGN